MGGWLAYLLPEEMKTLEDATQEILGPLNVWRYPRTPLSCHQAEKPQVVSDLEVGEGGSPGVGQDGPFHLRKGLVFPVGPGL